MGIVVTSTVLRIEQIGFQHNMRIEHAYQTAVSYVDFFLKIGENSHQYLLFPKFSRKIFGNFQKTEYMYKKTC